MSISSMQHMPWSRWACKSDTQSFESLLTPVRLLFGVAYWFVWTVALPHYRGYQLEESTDVLDDGLTITRLVKRYSSRNIERTP